MTESPNEAAPAKRYQTGNCAMGRLQADEEATAARGGVRNGSNARFQRNSTGAGETPFRKGLLRDAVESLLAGEVALGKELLRDYINATVGFPKLAEETKLHVKTLHQMFGPKGNPTASNLFEIVAYLQRQEGVRLQVRTRRAVA